MIEVATKILIAYLVGNIMGGLIIGRLRGVDLSNTGSGNIGATNALRTQGKGFAIAVLLIDVIKGLIGALLVPALMLPGLPEGVVDPGVMGLACGAAVTFGHCYPALWKFRGGKGVATLAGVFGALLPLSLPWILGGFVLIVMLTGYVSLATFGATAMAGFYVACIHETGALSTLGLFWLFMAGLVVFKHRENISRLLDGSESRFEKARVLGKWLAR